MNKLNFILASVLILALQVAHAEMGIPLQIKLKSPSGTYPTESGVNVKVYVLSPVTNCILREENFSSQNVVNGNLSVRLGAGVLGSSDPALTLNQVYNNNAAKNGLSCVDANNNIISTSQSYTPTVNDHRVIRITTNVSSEDIIVNFSMRSVPYAIQAEAVGGKQGADILVQNTSTALNQSNLSSILADAAHFTNLKNFAQTGTVGSATNFSGSLAGDVTGTQASTSVDRIRGVNVSATAPSVGQVLQYNGTQYVPVAIPSAPVSSVAGRTGAVVLSNTDISGLGSAAVLNAGTAANNLVQLDSGAKIPVSLLPNSVLTSSSSLSGDVTGNISATSVASVGGKSSSQISSAVDDVSAATASNTASTLVKRDASGNVTVNNVSSSNVSTNNVYLFDGANSIRLKAPAGLPANYILNLPNDVGSAGQVLQTDGSGNLSWGSVSSAGGTVNAVTASAPLSSSGGTNPNISLAQASASASGYLSSADFSSFNAKQNALGYTPVNQTAYNADVAGAASCSTTQAAYWNTVSDMWDCQNISFPADAVTSVAGRTGAVVLSSADISGLGSAAGLNVGTTAGTVAAGNDSRFTDARAPSGSASGDLSGTYPNPTVARIRNVNVNIAGLSANDILQYDGSQYVNRSIPTCGANQYLTFNGTTYSCTTDAGSAGSVVSLGVTAPIQNTGTASNPVIAMSAASASASGYLSSADFSSFSAKQNALGFTPLNPSNNLSELASASTARGNLGLGNSAVLNVGTAASTVAAGNDSRIVNAVQSSAYNADVAGASSCTSSQSAYWNTVSDMWACQNITFPADAVTSVAGRTGAVVLASADISGLGAAAGLNVGTTAGTVAAGNDSRFTDSRAPSGSASGDLSGTYPNPTVARIRNVNVSITGLSANDILQYNGTQYVNRSIPTCGANQYLTFNGTSYSCAADAGAGSVASVSVSSPVQNTGTATNPVIAMSAASASASGYLSSADFSSFSAKQNALGFTPLNPANNLSELASASTARTNLGLGGAAVLNVGTVASTVAAGNDSRIVNAVQSSAYAADVTPAASCTSTQTAYWNTVADAWACQNISFPAAPVSSVAGRTGAVVLSSADISGLGSAATLAYGSAAGQLVQLDGSARIPASTLPANALTTASAFSGDVSGNSSTISVDRIRGVAVSATAPVAGQALVYNGTEWVPTTGFPSFAKKTANQNFNSTTVADVTGLSYAVTAGVTYKYKFYVLYTSAAVGTGLKLGVSYPAATVASANARIAYAGDGGNSYYEGSLTSATDSVTATAVAATGTVYVAYVEGVLVPSANGTLQLRAGSETNGTNVTVQTNSFVEVTVVP